MTPRMEDFTRLLDWPGYKVYRFEIDDANKQLTLWVRRKRGNKVMRCSECGKVVQEIVETYQRTARDLPWRKYQTTVEVELHRVRCPEHGVRAEQFEQLPSNAPFTKDYEDEVGKACENAAASRVAVQFGLPASTVRAIDKRYLERWSKVRRKPPLRQMGVDEIYLGKKQQYVTVVSNLETGEPVWFGKEHKQATLDEFFLTQLSKYQRERITAACIDMWEPYTVSIQLHLPNCKIVYDKFHVMQLAGDAIDEVRRAEFFRKGGTARDLIKGKRWLLLSRFGNLTTHKQQELTELLGVNRRLLRAYLAKENLDRLWEYRSESAMLDYLEHWIKQLRWQRLKPFEKLANTLLKHVDGIVNYCKTKVPFGVVEALNGNIKALIRRGRGYRDLDYLLLKAQRLAATKTQFLVLQKAA